MEQVGVQTIPDRSGEYARRIRRQIPLSQYISTAFPGEEGGCLASAISDLTSNSSVVIEAGGRVLRAQLGCRVLDFTDVVRCDAADLYGPGVVRIGSLIAHLRDFPADRMTRPDLDFFVKGVPLETVDESLRSQSVHTTTHTATGRVQVLEANGSEGSATFVKHEDSFQAQPPWPMYGFQSPVVLDENAIPAIDVDILEARMFQYPLEMRG